MPAPDCLFVYGTLLSAVGHPMHRLLVHHARLIGPAWYQGRLYQVDTYPGAVPSTRRADRVHGEIYRLLTAEPLLTRLDAYEQCSAAYPEPREYRRVADRVTLPDGQHSACWIYLYNWPVADRQRIPSGDFLQR